MCGQVTEALANLI